MPEATCCLSSHAGEGFVTVSARFIEVRIFYAVRFGGSKTEPYGEVIRISYK